MIAEVDLNIESAESWLRHTIRQLVDHPDAADVRVSAGHQAALFEVTAHPDDIRRLLGRRGRAADAIRDLLHRQGRKAGRNFQLQIVDPEPSQG